MSRGQLRIYLGAAPGVGKTFAMLDEGFRRRSRGADVVVGYVETHGRLRTAAQLRDLEVVGRRRFEHRGATLEEMDVDAVLARRPQVVLVDELAHTNAPGSRHHKRWQDVEELLDAGITVIGTVNVQHLESLNDVVERITGVRQHETVPDVIVRRAQQVELVDMTPEALRRRMAHGNIYPAERIDAALSNYFRPGNLAALRELALLWVADRVDASLQDYLRDHGIDGTWETRERIVVAASGAPGGAELVRRAARLSARVRADLVALHVASATGSSTGADELDRQRALVRDLGGTYHEVVDDDPARAIVAFARRERATQVVLGTTARTWWQRLTEGSVIEDVVRRAGGIDVHIISTHRDGTAPATAAPRLPRRPTSTVSLRRRSAGLLFAAATLPTMTTLLAAGREDLELSTVFLAFLVTTVAATVIGGALVGLAVAVGAFLLENFYFIPPTHSFTVTEAEHLISLVGFLAFTAAASSAAQRITARGRDAARARAEAEALARTAGNLVGGADALPALVDNVRSTFGLDAVALLGRERDGWSVVAVSGEPVPHDPDAGESFTVDGETVLVLVGPAVEPDVRDLIGAFVGQAAAVVEARRLREEASKLDVIAQGDALRIGLLRSVSHDLRNPLAGIKASVTSLLQEDVTWSATEQQQFLEEIDEQCDRLNRLVTNLLDASRLHAGAVTPRLMAVAVDDVVAAALASIPPPPAPLEVELSDELPLIDSDPVLLERVIANLVSNAGRYAAPGSVVRITGGTVNDRVELLVIDRGPGIAPADREAALRPFQRLGDAGAESGVGLGLAVAHGLAELLGAPLHLDDTPGGGLTVALSLPQHRPAGGDGGSVDPGAER